MKRLLRPWPVVWLSAAIMLIIGSFWGGDVSIIAGWLFIAWTVPFGAIWWLLIYDHLPPAYGVPVQIIGEVASVIAAFWFWFLFMPAIRKRWKAK